MISFAIFYIKCKIRYVFFSGIVYGTSGLETEPSMLL